MATKFQHITFDQTSIELADKFNTLYEAIETHLNENFPGSAAKSFALVALQESNMWAYRAIADAQITREAQE